MAEKLLNEVPF